MDSLIGMWNTKQSQRSHTIFQAPFLYNTHQCSITVNKNRWSWSTTTVNCLRLWSKEYHCNIRGWETTVWCGILIFDVNYSKWIKEDCLLQLPQYHPWHHTSCLFVCSGRGKLVSIMHGARIYLLSLPFYDL